MRMFSLVVLVTCLQGCAQLAVSSAPAYAVITGDSSLHAHEHRHVDVRPAREFDFPALADGRQIAVVDLHTHSVFSDGHVWPTVRTWEAEKDGLDALAITEHLEYQPHADDIPHPDRNRAYNLAVESAARMPEAGLLVIPGAEITRRLPPGHVNAVFITDANALLTIDAREEDALENAREALEEAKAQDAFVFWNHPAWPRDAPDGILKVPAAQQALIDDGLIQGIEVANGHYFSEETLQYALDNDLVMLGTSDIHGLIDYDYDIEGGEHRTVTLVLTEGRSPEALKSALVSGKTVALYHNQFVGREAEVGPVLSAILTGEAGEMPRNSTVLQVTLRNSSSVPLLLRNLGPRRFSNASDIVTVPAQGEIIVNLNDAGALDPIVLDFEVLNSFIGVGKHLQLRVSVASAKSRLSAE